ncbi:MAG: type II CAAX endopeptidase family protein [Pseudomonadota bacterium]
MMQATPSQAMWLIARLRLRRLWNMIAGFSFRPINKTKSRAATPARKRVGWLLAGVMGVLMLFSAVNMARQSVVNIQCYLEPSSHCISVGPHDKTQIEVNVAADELHAARFSAPVESALAMQLSLLFLVSFLLPLSSREMAAADWDLEWLVTLPASRATLLWGRIAERTLVNPTGWILLTPFCAMQAWYAGLGWSAPLAGLAGALVLMPLAATLRTLVDTGLRMSLAPSQLRNVQAVTAILGMPFLYLAIAFSAMHAGSPVLGLARQFPAWSQWLPPGVMVKAINAGSAAQAGAMLALLALEIGAAIWLGMRVLRYQLRNGVVASGAREAARSAPPPAASTSALTRLLPASPIKRRELRLLGRDRNFLIQSLLLPIIIVGGQLLFTSSASAITEMANSPSFMAGMAFGIGSYMLMLSAFQTLNNEGQALWMLFTFPHAIEKVLKEKAEFWGVLALLYPVLILSATLLLAPAHALATLGLFAVVLAGIPIFSSIAVALGVFGCDPLATDVRTKVRPAYLYLYMLLSGVYIYAITAGPWPQKLVLIVLMAAFAQALWQKARDQLPFLLDPSASPPAQVSTADGLMAAMLFFVLQSALFLLAKWSDLPDAQAIVLAFAGAGVLVYAVMRLTYRIGKTGGVPALLRQNAGQALAWGAGAGVAAALVGLGYLQLVRHWDLFAEALQAGGKHAFAAHWLILLAVLAAPLCEEFIFRGLIFGGLRRSMGLAPSMLLSAALFAIVHPPVSMLPVFVLGLGTAWVYDRTRALLAPMLVHAIYNGVLVSYQLLG